MCNGYLVNKMTAYYRKFGDVKIKFVQSKSRIAALLAVVEDTQGTLKEADAAEMRLIEEIRGMGQGSL